jgi:hypothetical protein
MRGVDAGCKQAASGQRRFCGMKYASLEWPSDSPALKFFGTMNRQDTKDKMELAMMITPRVVRLAHQETVGPMLLLPAGRSKSRLLGSFQPDSDQWVRSLELPALSETSMSGYRCASRSRWRQPGSTTEPQRFPPIASSWFCSFAAQFSELQVALAPHFAPSAVPSVSESARHTSRHGDTWDRKDQVLKVNKPTFPRSHGRYNRSAKTG